MIETREDIVASKATLSRLPAYLRVLRDCRKAGDENVSSTRIAERLRLNPVQVRKDLALVAQSSGKPRLGFPVDELIQNIEEFLGLRNTHDAVLVGAGHLGSTLLLYEGFRNYGLNIVAAFDADPRRIGQNIGGHEIMDSALLATTVRRLNIKMGIVTVPREAAQAVADQMVAGGIRAIWSFAPIHLALPDSVAVKYEDLAASLAVLGKKLEDIIKNEE